MAPKKGMNSKATSSTGGKNKRGNKQPTQKTPMERVAVMGPSGKVRFVWRPWA